MTTYRYVEIDKATGNVLYAVSAASIEDAADRIGFDWDDAANLWAGVTPGKPVIDEEMPGINGITYTREFRIDRSPEDVAASLARTATAASALRAARDTIEALYSDLIEATNGDFEVRENTLDALRQIDTALAVLKD